MGAYLSTFAPCDSDLAAWHADGRQVHDAARSTCNVKAVFTNTVPVDAYRGAGRPEATFLLERVIEQGRARDGRGSGRAAPQELHPAEPVPLSDAGRGGLRHRGLRGGAGPSARARRLRGLRRAARAASKAKGKLRGIGVASYIEACGIAPSSLVGALGARAGLYEAATVRVNPTGSVTVHDRQPQPRAGP